MRIFLAVRIAALVAAASPLLALAQFQQPTPQELKMTSDPKAPGAAAVYLNIEEIADDGLHYQSFYARIKVLTEKGKELATVEVPYGGDFHVTDIKARTIHPDGTAIPLEGKPEDLLALKSGKNKFGREVFTLPSVEVGSILEYRYNLRYGDDHFSSPLWEVQRPYFVHEAHYMFTPFKAFLNGSQNATSRFLVDSKTGEVLNHLFWWVRLPPGSPALTSDALGRFSLEVSEIPPIPDEEYMPPLNSVLYRVFFYYEGSYTAQEFWNSRLKRWSKDVDRFADPSRAIREAVAGIVSPADSELDKAKKLYARVQALDNTDYSRQKSESELKQLNLKAARRAEDIWAQKSGDSDDIAMLYLAMLRAAGLQAWGLKVVDRSRGVFDPGYMSADQFDDMLVILDTGGKEIVLDPGEKMCPFETLNWRHADSVALRQGAKGPAFTKTPAQSYTDNTTIRSGNIALDEHGAVTGSITFVMTGQRALRWRQFALENDGAELKKRFDRDLEDLVPQGIDAHVDHFLSIDQPDANLIAVVKVKGSMGAATAKRLLLPGFLFESRVQEPFVKEAKRMEPVDMHYPERVDDQIVYHLPAAFTVEGAPQNAEISWKGHAVYLVKTTANSGQISVARALARGFAEAKPEEYQDLRGFYRKVATSDQQEIVLRAAPAVQGN